MFKLAEWNDLPEYIRNESVKPYYDTLSKKRAQIFIKRCFDLLAGSIIAIILLPIMLLLSIMIKLDSKGPVMFRQERVTTNGKVFRIYKFRTMVVNAESLGTQVTSKSDSRITRIGKLLRKVRLDELPQIFNVILGDMSFVGTRPEVPRYVSQYSDEMYATLLLPAGITSVASIKYKDEEWLLSEAENADKTYVDVVLPGKMAYNIEYLNNFNLFNDVLTMINTVFAVIKRDKDIEKPKVDVNV